MCFCSLLFLIRHQDMEELKNSSPRKEKYYEKEEKEQDGLSDSSSEEMNFKGSHHQGLALI